MASLFGTLLRSLRARHALSQLDLALAAEVSARHLSFLETGRAQPSEGMVLRLASVLGLSPREENELLVSAGLGALHPQSTPWPDDVARVLDQMIAKHEPYPLVVLDPGYRVLAASRGAQQLLARAGLGLAPDAELNLLELLFDPALLRRHVIGWPLLAERLLARARREALMHPSDPRITAVIERLKRHPDVPRGEVQLAAPSSAVVPLTLAIEGTQRSFVATTTTFSVPHDLCAADVRIESLFPADEATHVWLERAAG